MLTDVQKLLRAVSYAAEQHVRQRRKGIPHGTRKRTPYINHPLRVASLISHAGVDDITVLCAAVLHDTIEDTDTTELDLREHFGDRVTDIVLEVTDDKELPKPERRRLQIMHAPNLSAGAALVKLADKVDNIRDLVSEPPDWTPERVQEYFDHARQVVDSISTPNQILLGLFNTHYSKRKTLPQPV